MGFVDIEKNSSLRFVVFNCESVSFRAAVVNESLVTLVIFYTAQSKPRRARHKDTFTRRPHYLCSCLACILTLSLPAPVISPTTVATFNYQGPNEQQTYSVETSWTGRLIKADESEGK